MVTSQIPLYNERHVARRVIESVAALDYPAGRHEIQVLDDSNDETRDLVDQVAAELGERGCIIQVVRRGNREGYKAGALAAGLRPYGLAADVDAVLVEPDSLEDVIAALIQSRGEP